MSNPTDHHDSELGHVVPFKVYLNTFIALVVLTVVTVLTAKFVDLGNGNIVLAMVIASAKALIVAMLFMHLKFENPLTWAYAAFPILLLALLMGGLFIDNPFRGHTVPAEIVDALKTDNQLVREEQEDH